MSTDTETGRRRVIRVTLDVALNAQTFRYTRKMPEGQTIIDGVGEYVTALVTAGDASVLTPVLTDVSTVGVGNAPRDSELRDGPPAPDAAGEGI